MVNKLVVWSVVFRVQNNPGFLKKAQPSGFFWVFGFYWVFMDKQEKIGKIIQKLSE